MAEMAERAQLISEEAGTKIAAAMKDVIGAAAGLAGFAVESARDLLQYMVRRGQITQDEADKLIREAEDAHAKRSGRSGAKPVPPAAKPEKKAPAKREAATKKSTSKQSSSKKKR
jgi:polyhydroxyalkanoate synthesis regulator phasin